jgi:hypothetical protein
MGVDRRLDLSASQVLVEGRHGAEHLPAVRAAAVDLAVPDPQQDRAVEPAGHVVVS